MTIVRWLAERHRFYAKMPKQNALPEDLAALGARIASVRVHCGLTQRELCARIPMDPQNLSKVERGIHAPGSMVIRDICRALGVSPDYIVLGPDRPEKTARQWIDPELLWESGVERRARRGGADVNAQLLQMVRQSRLGQKAKLGEPFNSIDELDDAVEEAWQNAEAKLKRTTKVVPIPSGKVPASIVEQTIQSLRKVSGADEEALREVAKIAASGTFEGRSKADVKKLVEAAYRRASKKKRKS